MSNLNSTYSPESLEMQKFVFDGIDYTVFVLMLCISAGIGGYFGFVAKGADTTDEYLMGGKRMKTIPIAISLVASQLSGISIMTVPGEIYTFGVNFLFTILTMVINIPLLCYIVIPVFYNNNISNCYEYLELRYNRATRRVLTIAFMGTIFIFLPVYNFIPSLAFSQVTNINIHVINAIVSSICVFYTMLGGIKAVVWTDVVQAAIMVVSVVFIGIMGVVKVGGISEVLRLASNGHRLDVDFTFDWETRMTFWNGMISGISIWVSYIGFNQSCVQRIVSLPSLGHAQMSLIIFGFGFLLIMGFNCFTGIIMYARFSDCDPLTAGYVEKPDKLVPFFVQDVIGHLRGIPGLFISCVFSASLSTISASMNALAGVIYMDYIKPHIRHTESRANFIMKAIVFIFGIYSIIGGVVVAKFSSILQILYSIGGVTFGAVFGVFTMGMLVPKTHGRAAFWSVIVSMLILLIIILGAQGRVFYDPLPGSIEGCFIENITHISSKNETTLLHSVAKETDTGFDPFKMSYNWYIVVGAVIVYVVGIPLSYILPPEKNERLNPNLLSPIVHRFTKYNLAETHDLNEIKMKVDMNL